MDIERLLNRHKDAVYKQMVKTCGNFEDAEDALADAMLAAFKASAQLKDPANFQAWLAKIGTRVCTRIRIRERILRSTSIAELESSGFQLPDDHVSPAKEAELSLLKNCVAGALDLLPEIYRDVYLRREIAGDKAEDVAAALGLSVPAVKSRLYRARELMRDTLDRGLGCKALID